VLKLKHLISFVLISFLVLFSFSSKAVLPKCEDVFPSALATTQTNWNTGFAYVDRGATISNQQNNLLATGNVVSGVDSSCNGYSCMASGVNAEPMIAPSDFISNAKNSVPSDNRLNGDYYLTSLDIHNRTLTVAGPTRIYMNGSIALSRYTKFINNYTSDSLLLYVNGSVSIYDSVDLNAFMYSTGHFNLGANASFLGAYTSQYDAILGQYSSLSYQAPTSNNFDGFCEASKPAQLISEYRFDETNWDNGSSGHVIDSVSGFNATAFSTQPSRGLVCNAADLSSSGIDDYIKLNEQAISNGEDFSISLWLNSDKTDNQSILSGANSGYFNELIMWFPSNTSFSPHLNGVASSTIGNPSISDGWHHIVWTRNGTENCLYVDKAKQACISLSNSEVDISSLILGQEQDSLGGGFVSSQAVEGLIDELLIFEGALTQKEVDDIYDNQLMGKGFDGSDRVCPEVKPILDLRFDELNYSGTNALLDSSGNNYDATAFDTSPTDGLLCNAADLTTSSDTDLIEINPEAMNGLTDFTIVIWAKTNSDHDGTILSAAQNGTSLGANEATWLMEVDDGDFTFWPTIAESPFDEDTELDVEKKLSSWKQLVWTRKASNNQSCFYYNGKNKGCVTHNNNNNLLEVTGLVLGQDQDSRLGGYDSSQDWEGLLDELLIFDMVLSKDEINDIKDNIENSKNWDGTQRTCPTLEPIAEYRFDEPSWGDNKKDVKDSSFNSLDLTAHNAQTEYSNPVPALDDGTNFCRYGEFNGQDNGSYLELSSTDFDLTNELTITAWININQLPNELNTIVSKDDNYEFHVTSNGEINWWWGNRSLTTTPIRWSAANIQENKWHHIAITYRSGSQVIYIDGQSKGEASYSGNLNLNNKPFQIGQDQNHPGRFFNGSIDEVRVYNQFLSQQDIQNIMEDSRTCTQQVDHYQIRHDGKGLTCEAESISIKACVDSDCNLYGSPVSLDLLVDGQVYPTGVFTGEAKVDIAQKTPDTLTLSVGNESVSASNPFVCIKGDPNGAACDIEFTDVGFKFLYGAANSDSIPYQVAGEPFESLKLQAVENNNGVCDGLFSGNIDVKLSQTNLDPGGTSGLAFKVGNKAIIKATNADNGTAVTLSFNTNSIATLSSSMYLDAGEIKLNAQYKEGDLIVEGSSNEFWISPKKLAVSAKFNGNNLAGNTHSNPVIHKAGSDFDFEVKALNALGSTTLNYFPGQIQLKLERKGPTAHGAEGRFTCAGSCTIDTALSSSPLLQYQNVILTSFTAGISAFSGANYSEVGLINLSLKDNNYGNESIVVMADAIDIGRFIPASFTVENNSVSRACAVGDFTYFSEPFLATYTLKAKNAAGDITKNYQGDFVKEDVKYWLENEAIGSDYQSGNDLESRLPDVNPEKSQWQNGELLIVDESIVFNRADIEAPYVDTGLLLSIENSEGGVLAGNQDHLNLGGALIPAFQLNTSPLEFRYGRLALHDSYGSEFDEMQIPMRTEYSDDGQRFILNTADNCTDYDNNLVQISPVSPSLDFIIKGTNPTFNAGVYKSQEGIFVKPLGSEQQGNFIIEYSATPSWLLFDWDNNTLTPDENPKSNIQFGRFRSNDRVIYWREQ